MLGRRVECVDVERGDAGAEAVGPPGVRRVVRVGVWAGRGWVGPDRTDGRVGCRAGVVPAWVAAAGDRRVHRRRARQRRERGRVRLRGSGPSRSAFAKARVVALAECGTPAFVAAEVDAYATGEKTPAQRLYPRLCGDELLVTDRGFYSWQAWDTAAATGAALVWRAPTQLDLPVVRVLPDGTWLTVLIRPTIRGARRERLLNAARAGVDPLDADAVDDWGLPVVHPARVVEYTVPDRAGNGTGEVITLITKA